jgi:hypothetical protein
MLERGRCEVWSAVTLRTFPRCRACLPREEEGLPVHDHRILRDGGLELQYGAAMAARSSLHCLEVGERREMLLGTLVRLRHGCSALQASSGLCQNSH